MTFAPCPFCGGPAKAVVQRRKNFVECCWCEARRPGDARSWAQRVQPLPPQPQAAGKDDPYGDRAWYAKRRERVAGR